MQAIDGDTGQVGPGIAEDLNLAQVTYVTDIELENGVLKIEREVEDGHEIIEVKKPALITVTKTKEEPRYPTLRSKISSFRAEIDTITSEDINLDIEKIGLKGSSTRVSKIFVTSVKTPGEKKEGLTLEETVESIIDYMTNLNLI